jgi:hypothetical protein
MLRDNTTLPEIRLPRPFQLIQREWGMKGQSCHADDTGRTDGRTMAAGSSVTWRHYSVRYEVTWG